MKKKNTHTRRAFIGSTLVTGLGLTTILSSCSKSTGHNDPMKPNPDPEPPKNNELKITGHSIPFNIDVSKGMQFTITGRGFAAGDTIQFRAITGGNSGNINITVDSVTENNSTITIPDGLSSVRYELHVQRASETFLLGSTTLNVVFNANIPNLEGMTVKGVVYAAGVGLADVVVSDGFAVTKTDQDGTYYLPSTKTNKYVFISIPSNHEVKTAQSLPLFFNRLDRPEHIVEIKDFELTRVNNDDHIVMILGDMHLANRNQDLNQFQNGFLSDINQSIANYKSKGKKVYALTLGDMSWETYWASSKFALPEYLREMNKINATVFNTIGNHDNNPAVSGDWETAGPFRDIIGPNYYSFNIGKAHYVVLDNIEYLNTVIGDRNYNAKIMPEQIDWLKKDLAMITDKSTPIVVAMHIQLFSNPSLSGQNETRSIRVSNGEEFINIMKEFSNVHVYTGHTHMNYNARHSASLMEHNIGVVCATWWWTGFLANNHICKDGTPGGYVIWDVTNKDLKWTYKSIGQNEDYQFRAYDLNKVHLTKEKYAPAYTGTEWNNYAHSFASLNNKNEVLINVWNYDTDWKVEVTENNQPLTVTRIRERDPLHIISYSAKRLNQNAVPTTDFVTALSAHMFKVTASTANSTLEIKVTDCFGRVFKQTMKRPKEMSLDMS